MGGLIVSIKKFLRLHDTPNSFTDQAGKVVAVNVGEDALEFVELTSEEFEEGAFTFLKLTDTPASYVDQAGKFVKVNAGEDGVEFSAVNGNGGLVEGDYTTWTYKWSADIPRGLYGPTRIDMILDDANNRMVLAWRVTNGEGAFGIYSLADFSQIFLSTVGSDYQRYEPENNYTCGITFGVTLFECGGMSQSLQTYILLMRSDRDTIEVWRSGNSPLWSRNTALDEAGTLLMGGIISPTGKYIVVYTASNKLICYEGS